jgi:hypothetical protein
MSRLLSLIGLVAFATLGVAACHSSGPPGGDQMPDPMDPMNPMYRVPSAATHSPAAPTACRSPFTAAKCSPVESR